MWTSGITENAALFRVQQVRLAVQAPVPPVQSGDLGDCEAGRGQYSRDSGPIGAGSFDTDERYRASGVEESHDLPVTGQCGVELAAGEHRPKPSTMAL